MTAPLDEKGLAAVEQVISTTHFTNRMGEAKKVLSAYLSAVALPDELEGRLKPNAVVDHVPGLAVSNLRRVGSDDLAERLNQWIVQNNALKAEAHSTIAALRAERDEAIGKAERQWAGWVKEEVRRKEAEAEAKRLTEEKEALREQLTRPDAERRQWFIGDTLVRNGFINRADLTTAFGISVPQASSDIQAWLAANPGKAVYNSSAKRYEAAGGLNAPS